jgi:hypothetical protein
MESSSVLTPQEAARRLFELANQNKVRFPKVMDESKIRQTCGATVVSETM